MAPFIPLRNRKVKELAGIFVRKIWRLYGLRQGIVSDRDTVFRSSFWQKVMWLLEVALDKSSAYHSQTDSQTEWVNHALAHYLRTYCTWDQDNWVQLLSFVEFCYNYTVYATTKLISIRKEKGLPFVSLMPPVTQKANCASRSLLISNYSTQGPPGATRGSVGATRRHLDKEELCGCQ